MRKKEEQKRLEALKRFEILDTEAEKEFDALTELASYICNTPISLISLLDEDRQWFKSNRGLDVKETPRNIAFCNEAIQQDDIYEVENALLSEKFKENPLVTGNPNIRFYAGAPLKDEDGNKLGTLCVIDREPKKLSDSQKKALAILAEQAMARIELRQYQSHLRSEVEQKTHHLKQHVKDLEKTRQELDQQKKFLRKIIDTSPGLIFVKNQQGVYRLANQALAKLYKTTTEELEGKSDYDFNPNKDQVDAFLQKDMEAIQGKREIPPFEELVSVDDTINWYRTVKVPLELEEGTHVLGLASEITGLKNLEGELKIRNQELEEFLYNASHDLRGPIASLLGVTHLLKMENDVNLVREYTAMIEELGVKLDTTLARLLEVRGIINKDPDLQPLRIKEAVATLIEQNYPQGEVVFTVENFEREMIVTDREILKIAIDKILNNASQFHLPEQQDKKVVINCVLEGDDMVLSISDNGRGIKAHYLPRLTQMFFKAHANADGSGLGLYIAKKAIERLGGTIRIESEWGQGTTVHLRWPYQNVF